MLHLLIIEDNSADVLLVREALRQCAIAADVVIASDGQRAIQVLSQPDFRPDFILLDLNLPKVDGFQVLEHFHGDAGAPVVVLTSSENPDDRQRALAIGASGYFTKPYGMDGWKRTICGIVERWSPGKSMRADSAN